MNENHPAQIHRTIKTVLILNIQMGMMIALLLHTQANFIKVEVLSDTRKVKANLGTSKIFTSPKYIGFNLYLLVVHTLKGFY